MRSCHRSHVTVITGSSLGLGCPCCGIGIVLLSILPLDNLLQLMVRVVLLLAPEIGSEDSVTHLDDDPGDSGTVIFALAVHDNIISAHLYISGLVKLLCQSSLVDGVFLGQSVVVQALDLPKKMFTSSQVRSP